MPNFFAAIAMGCALATFSNTRPTLAQMADYRTIYEEGAQHAATILEKRPAIEPRSRIPSIKVLRILDKETIYLKTDNIPLNLYYNGGLIDDRLYMAPAPDGKKTETKPFPNARAPSALTYLADATCMVGRGIDGSELLLLLKVTDGKAIFEHSGRTRDGKKYDEFISVGPYEDGHWSINPMNPGETIYTETDEHGVKRIERREGGADGQAAYLNWYPNGQMDEERRKMDKDHDFMRYWDQNGYLRDEYVWTREGPDPFIDVIMSADGLDDQPTPRSLGYVVSCTRSGNAVNVELDMDVVAAAAFKAAYMVQFHDKELHPRVDIHISETAGKLKHIAFSVPLEFAEGGGEFRIESAGIRPRDALMKNFAGYTLELDNYRFYK